MAQFSVFCFICCTFNIYHLLYRRRKTIPRMITMATTSKMGTSIAAIIDDGSSRESKNIA